jgi:menaquinone-dependent protoporphyrinogen IX oxidase
MKDTLVVYFSNTGVTRKLAREIANIYDCDLEEIHEPTPRNNGFRGFAFSGFQAFAKTLPEIEDLVHKPSDYEHTVVGTPVWVGHMSSPIRSFLYHHGSQIKKASFFTTYNGSGGVKVIEEMSEYCDKPIHSSFAFSKEVLQSPKYLDRRIRDFIWAWQKPMKEESAKVEKKRPVEAVKEKEKKRAG